MMLSHAAAVQRAIREAQRDNAAFQQRTALAELYAAQRRPSAPTAAGVVTPAVAPTGATYRVSNRDVVLGLRVGERLMLVDDQDSKTSEFVMAIDALLRKAREALGPERGASLSTNVGRTPATLTLTRAMRSSGDERAGGAMGAEDAPMITITYKETPEARPQEVDAIGRLDWRL